MTWISLTSNTALFWKKTKKKEIKKLVRKSSPSLFSSSTDTMLQSCRSKFIFQPSTKEITDHEVATRTTSAITFEIIELVIITVFNHLLTIPMHTFTQYFMRDPRSPWSTLPERETIRPINDGIFVSWNIKSSEIEWNCSNHILQIAIYPLRWKIDVYFM